MSQANAVLSDPDRVGVKDQLSINTIRTLAIDAVQQANSGHPGAPMGLAPVVYQLWQKFLRYDPADPTWMNRDRFVLSAGHASMLLYATLHLAGVRAVNAKGEVTDGLAVPMEEIKRFRQIDSRTPGHPESHLTTGVETTTGPLGQGAGNSVGMAIAGKWLAENFNKPGFDIFNFNVYAILGDGDMMEGVACEAASLAGHVKLSNLCWIYDNNRVTLDGPAEWSFSEDVMTRFAGYGWNVTHVTDANDLEMLADSYENFLKTKDRPTLIVVDSHIGYGSPHKQDSYEAHGEPLGEAEVKLVKKNYGWPEDAKFLVPDGVYDQFKNGVGKRGAEARAAWKAKFEEYKKQFPQLAGQLNRMQHGHLPDGWDKDLPSFPADAKGMATRESSGKTLNALAKNIPWLIGGSADLAKSNKTNLTFDGAGDFYPNQYRGRNIHFGVREHAMGAIVNGMTLSKLRAFSATFFNFSDYMRPSMRLGALMEIPSIYIFTHDSIGVGEDGPTHQPIEQLASLRAMPNMLVSLQSDPSTYPWAFDPRSDSPSHAYFRSNEICLRLRSGERRLRSCRSPGRKTRRDPHGQRERGFALRGSQRKTKRCRHQGSRRQHAFMGTFRASGCRLQGERSSCERNRASIRGNGFHVWLGALRRPQGQDDRHAQLRRIGATEGFVKEIRHRSGQSCGGGEASSWKVSRQ